MGIYGTLKAMHPTKKVLPKTARDALDWMKGNFPVRRRWTAKSYIRIDGSDKHGGLGPVFYVIPT